MSLMPKVWYSIKMSGLYIVVHFVWNMMKHLPCMPTLHLQYLCFVFMRNKHTLTGWARADWDGPARQTGFVQEPCAAKPARRPGDSRQGPPVRNAF